MRSIVSSSAACRPVILVVEDDATTREIVASYLSRAGFDTLLAADGAEAVAHVRLRARLIDGLFTDIRLPGPISGYDVADAFQLLHPFKPVVCTTGSRVAGDRLPPDGILLAKPYRPAQIVEAFLTLQRERDAWRRKE